MINKIKNIANTEDKKRLLSNFFSLSVLQAFTYILPLLTLPYLVRVLGVDKFGLVMFAQAFLMFFNILVDYGFNLSATREIAVNRDNKDKVTEIFSSVMSIKAILIVVSFIILTIIIFSFEKFSSDWELYYFSFLMVIGQAFFPIWYFQGMERMKYITIVNVFSRVIFTVAIFVFIQEEADYIIVPILNGFGFIIGSFISLWMIHKYFDQKFKIQNYATMMIHFKDSSQFFLSRVSVSIYTSANAFVLGLYTNTTMVGYYAIAEKLYLALQGLYGPVSQTLFPYISKNNNLKLFKKIFFISILLNTIGLIIVFLFGSEILSFLFSNSVAEETINVLYLLVIAFYISIPSILIGYPLLGALGYSKYPNFSIIYASIIHILGLFILISSHNITIYNIALLVIFTQLVELLYRVYGVYKYKIFVKR
jgi:polysaccharide transporter, PST family